MKVVYTPEDGDRLEWDFNPVKVKASQMIPVEKVFEGTWQEFVASVMQGSASAYRVLLWHLQRRQHPEVRFDDTPDFSMDEVEVTLYKSDFARLQNGVKNAPGATAAQKAAALDALDEAIADAPADADSGKAR